MRLSDEQARAARAARVTIDGLAEAVYDDEDPELALERLDGFRDTLETWAGGERDA